MKRPLWQIAAGNDPIDNLPNIADHDYNKIPDYKDIIEYWRTLENEQNQFR